MITAATDSVSPGTAQTPVMAAQDLDRDAFLNLLVTQLQHQDPLNPTDSVEFTAQLAQFSSLEQLGNVNDNLKQLQDLQASINNSQAVSLIGKEITANGNFLTHTGGQPVGCDFMLDGNAAVVGVSIYDHTGEFVKSFEGLDLSAGHHTLPWDGTNQNGSPVGSGNYTFEVMAADDRGNAIQTTTFFSGSVDKVIFENNTTYLISGDQRVALGDIIEVGVVSNIADNQTGAEQNNH
jgi:flagellar basal-body rod modification protein FlgD